MPTTPQYGERREKHFRQGVPGSEKADGWAKLAAEEPDAFAGRESRFCAGCSQAEKTRRMEKEDGEEEGREEERKKGREEERKRGRKG